MRIYINFLMLVMFININFQAEAQNPKRLKNEVNRLVEKDYAFNHDNPRVVFVGSSSIKHWKDVQEYFPNYNIINNGFGGSTFTDLLYYYDELILNENPEILFIYEGDNDIGKYNKSTEEIIKEASILLDKVQKDLPNTRIILMTPKPSIRRWDFKKEYEAVNERLQKLAADKEIEFANVWEIMLDENGMVYQDIFMHDKLHMNKKGYKLWAKALKPYLNH